jgi:hypothetical protein
MAQTRGGRYRATARARPVLGVVVVGEVEPEAPTRTAYASLGYRLLATEGFFVQRLWRVAKPQTPVSIEWVRTPDLAARLGKVTRTRPISNDLLGDEAAFRQYVALDADDIWVACAASMPREPPGARICMSILRTGVVGLARRCCPECCATTGRVVPSARC